ncbi:MAG: signal peptidase II [Aerococcus sp.]|nr:signal peptidase II [Aerococcus sp.]
MWIYYLVILTITVIDQGVKAWTVAQMPLGSEVPLIPNVVSLFHLRNTGAAWGMLADQQTLFLIITVAVVMVLLYTLHKQGRQSVLYGLSLSLIIAGAIGNFIDRVRLHYVVDMFKLEFINFPIFNVADTAITIGVILMIIYLFFFEEGKHA